MRNKHGYVIRKKRQSNQIKDTTTNQKQDSSPSKLKRKQSSPTKKTNSMIAMDRLTTTPIAPLMPPTAAENIVYEMARDPFKINQYRDQDQDFIMTKQGLVHRAFYRL